jgi:transcriptional regulator with XRE-family HTH domain
MYVEVDGQKVRELREQQGATAGEIADKAGITRSTLRRVERNEGPVLPGTARGIGRALDVNPRSFAWAISTRLGRQD